MTILDSEMEDFLSDSSDEFDEKNQGIENLPELQEKLNKGPHTLPPMLKNRGESVKNHFTLSFVSWR